MWIFTCGSWDYPEYAEDLTEGINGITTEYEYELIGDPRHSEGYTTIDFVLDDYTYEVEAFWVEKAIG